MISIHSGPIEVIYKLTNFGSQQEVLFLPRHQYYSQGFYYGYAHTIETNAGSLYYII